MAAPNVDDIRKRLAKPMTGPSLARVHDLVKNGVCRREPRSFMVGSRLGVPPRLRWPCYRLAGSDRLWHLGLLEANCDTAADKPVVYRLVGVGGTQVGTVFESPDSTELCQEVDPIGDKVSRLGDEQSILQGESLVDAVKTGLSVECAEGNGADSRQL